MEDYKKCHIIIGNESEIAFCQQYEDYKILQAKLDQTLLCEKIANELLSQQKTEGVKSENSRMAEAIPILRNNADTVERVKDSDDCHQSLPQEKVSIAGLQSGVKVEKSPASIKSWVMALAEEKQKHKDFVEKEKQIRNKLLDIIFKIKNKKDKELFKEVIAELESEDKNE
jgi:hypothetical protein